MCDVTFRVLNVHHGLPTIVLHRTRAVITYLLPYNAEMILNLNLTIIYRPLNENLLFKIYTLSFPNVLIFTKKNEICPCVDEQRFIKLTCNNQIIRNGNLRNQEISFILYLINKTCLNWWKTWYNCFHKCYVTFDNPVIGDTHAITFDWAN